MLDNKGEVFDFEDSHELVAEAMSCGLEDALPLGFLRSGVHADYSFYGAYAEVRTASRAMSSHALSIFPSLSRNIPNRRWLCGAEGGLCISFHFWFCKFRG